MVATKVFQLGNSKGGYVTFDKEHGFTITGVRVGSEISEYLDALAVAATKVVKQEYGKGTP